MKVGIIVHSYTGNTLNVAQRLMEEFLAGGHSAELKQVTAVNEDPSKPGNIQLETIPDTGVYDVIIFGAPVRGFSLSPAMKAYLSQIESLKCKKVGCFVTELLPYKWMGGTRAIGQMKKACELKGVSVFETGVVNWSNKKRENLITNVAKKLSSL